MSGIYGLKVGDIILARKKFLTQSNGHYVDSRFIVKEVPDVGDCYYILENYHDGKECRGFVSEENFFPVNDVNLNRDIEFILRNYEIKSFNATTMCGKAINVELPNPYRLDLSKERKINIEKRD